MEMISTRHYLMPLLRKELIMIAELDVENASTYEIPDFYSDKAKKICEAMITFFHKNDLFFSGYPEGDKVFLCCDNENQLIKISHDGGQHGDAFSYDNLQYEMIEKMDQMLERYGVYSEQINSYSSGIYYL